MTIAENSKEADGFVDEKTDPAFKALHKFRMIEHEAYGTNSEERLSELAGDARSIFLDLLTHIGTSGVLARAYADATGPEGRPRVAVSQEFAAHALSDIAKAWSGHDQRFVQADIGRPLRDVTRDLMNLVLGRDVEGFLDPATPGRKGALPRPIGTDNAWRDLIRITHFESGRTGQKLETSYAIVVENAGVGAPKYRALQENKTKLNKLLGYDKDYWGGFFRLGQQRAADAPVDSVNSENVAFCEKTLSDPAEIRRLVDLIAGLKPARIQSESPSRPD